MFKITKNITNILAAVIVLAAPLLAAGQVFAASATMSLSPARTSLSKGSIITIGVYENSGGTPVDTAQANLTYPANLLDFVGIVSSSAFAIAPQSTGGGGTVTIARGALPSVTGSKLVASVRFKAKTNSGTAIISIASGQVQTTGTNIYAGGSGATITLKDPPAPTPAAPKDTTPPTISNVKVSEITNNTATVTWTTSEPSTSAVDYGYTASYGLAAADTASVTEHKLVLNSALLRPGETYHYVVKSIDPAGNAVSGKDATFKTTGLNMSVTVVDQKSKGVEGATVKFQGKQAKTNSSGKATLTDLKLDRGNLVVSQGGKETSQVVEVIQSAPNTAKPVTVKITPASSGSSGAMLLLVALFLLAALSLWYFLRKAKKLNDDDRTVITPPPVVPGSDPDLKSAGPSKDNNDDLDEETPKATVASDKPSKAFDENETAETIVIKPDKSKDDDSDTV